MHRIFYMLKYLVYNYYISTQTSNAYATTDARSIGIQTSTLGDGLNVTIKNKSGTSESTTYCLVNQGTIAQSNAIINTTGVLSSTVGNNATINITNQAGTATAQIANSGNVARVTASVYAYGTRGNATIGNNATINIDSTAGHTIYSQRANQFCCKPCYCRCLFYCSNRNIWRVFRGYSS